ncbi:ABC transporter permease [Thioclava electrotropha]|uniref:Transport permease protein n=1 Tax=Thioclava electrotropha TaxID=1549850 RepID=A0ABX6YYD8_9RHOB|nr:ABC transporter permease [Thioclava electrotropha]QPZ92673.1 ABC transporter permease [Thioclava electrotropha]
MFSSRAARIPARSFPALRAIGALILREMSASYGRSPGGYLWALLEPIGGVALLTLFFSLTFHAPPLGASFALFYATGLLPFMLFSDVQSKVANALTYSRALLAYPTVSFVDALIARLALNALTKLVVSYLVLHGCLLMFDTRASPDPLRIFEAAGLAVLLSFGIGTLNCYLFLRAPVWQQIWSILMRPMFLISGVFFLTDQLPRWAVDTLWFNPLVHVIGYLRRSFFPTYQPDYLSAFYVIGVSLVALALGLLALRRSYRVLLAR